jgi:hypothetical protein
MTAVEFVTRVIDALEQLHVPYMAVGSFSVNVYANPRSTKDADFVVQFGDDTITQIMNELGSDFELDQQMSFETITATTRYKVRHRQTLFLIELFFLSDDPHDRQRFARRLKGDINGRPVYVPTAEDVIIQKLRWSRHGKRQKDVDDARNVLAVQAGRLDIPYMRGWCDEHGTREVLEQLIQETKDFEQEKS